VNMLPTTFDVLKAALRADLTIPVSERNQLLALLRRGPSAPKSESDTPRVPRILRRKTVAERLGRSLRSVDMLAAEGTLRKIKLPGRQRCAGFLEDDVNRLLVEARAP
jgi:hypothetical protein